MMEILHEQNPSIFLFGLPSLYGVSNEHHRLRRRRPTRSCGCTQVQFKVTRTSRDGAGAAADGRLHPAAAGLHLPLTLLLVAFATFVVLRLTGNPVDIFLDINRTPEQVAGADRSACTSTSRSRCSS